MLRQRAEMWRKKVDRQPCGSSKINADLKSSRRGGTARSGGRGGIPDGRPSWSTAALHAWAATTEVFRPCYIGVRTAQLPKLWSWWSGTKCPAPWMASCRDTGVSQMRGEGEVRNTPQNAAQARAPSKTNLFFYRNKQKCPERGGYH